MKNYTEREICISSISSMAVSRYFTLASYSVTITVPLLNQSSLHHPAFFLQSVPLLVPYVVPTNLSFLTQVHTLIRCLGLF